MNNEKLYTAADFVSYHAGTMPVHDMHALEKAALEDPFLTDALEGYAFSKTPLADVSIIKDKLNLKAEKPSLFAVTSNNKSWMRIAASITIVLGLSYLFYNINKKEDTQNALADNTIQQQVKADTMSKEKSAIDTIANIESAASKPLSNVPQVSQQQTTTNPIKKDTDLRDSEAESTAKANQISDDKSKQIAAITQASGQSKTEAPTANAAPVVSSRKDASANEEVNKERGADLTQNNRMQNNVLNYYNYSGVVQKPTGGPMQNAVVRSRNIATQTDQNGRFNFRATDSNLNATIAAVGFAEQNVLLNTNTVPTFTLDFDNTSLNEVVVTGYSKQKKSKQQSVDPVSISKAELNKIKNIDLEKGLAGKIPGMQVKNGKDDIVLRDSISLKKLDIDAELKTFNNYIIQNIKPVFDNNGNEIKGKVILSFIASKKGNPQKIKIIQSVNSACNKQAIELLKNGPNWKMKKGDKKVIAIEF
jgi:Gram-negative bacterial TonB protein C-terminal